MRIALVREAAVRGAARARRTVRAAARAAVRAAAVPFVAFLVVAAGLTAVEAGEFADAKVRARVREYTETATSEPRRELIVRELISAGAPEAAVVKLVREALVSDVRRGPALDLAARLRLPGVFESAKRHANGPAAAAVAALALAAPEPGAGVWLAERWVASPPEGEAFLVADAALRERRAPPGAVEVVARSLGDPLRAERALEVLRAQMGIDDTSAEDLRTRWDAAWKRYVFESEEVRGPGEDLLAFPGWQRHAARAVGRNLRLPPLTAIALAPLPAPLLGATGSLRLRIAPGDGKEAFVSLATAGNALDLRLSCDGSSWFLVEGPPREGARVEVPCRKRAWCEVELRITDPRIPGEAATRDVRVLVDGREVRPSGGFWRLPTVPESLTVGAAEGDEPTLVGGLTWKAEAK